MLFRTYNMERGLWACELDSFFLFMAYLSFAFLFSFLITVVIEKPCHNLFETFVLGSREVYLRSPASAPAKGKKKTSRLSDESESDAETLDKLDVDEDAAATTATRSSFLSNSAAYKPRSKLILDPEETSESKAVDTRKAKPQPAKPAKPAK